jgi:AI-2 transport protein TqsA
VVKTATCAVLGLCVGGSFYLLRIPLALLFGLITFLCNFVPNVGAVVSIMVPLPVVVLDAEVTWSAALLAFAIPALLHMMVGTCIEPLLIAHDEKLELGPIVILIGVAIWGYIWGVAGMVLSVPLTLALKVVCQHAEQHTRCNIFWSVERLLTGRFTDKKDKGH